jgi:hypothetical protein
MKIVRDGSSEDHVVWGLFLFLAILITSHRSQEFMRLLGHLGESRVFPGGRPANLAA